MTFFPHIVIFLLTLNFSRFGHISINVLSKCFNDDFFTKMWWVILIRWSLLYLKGIITFTMIATKTIVVFSTQSGLSRLRFNLIMSPVPMSWHVFIIHESIINVSLFHAGNDEILYHHNYHINYVMLWFRAALLSRYGHQHIQHHFKGKSKEEHLMELTSNLWLKLVNWI